jgi:hypothetical protein
MNSISLIKNTRVALFLFATLLCIALRLYLTSDRDILAVNQGADDLWQIRTAAEGVWSSDYSHMKGVHLPVYASWLYLCSLLGMPARLAYDLLWCLAALVLGGALCRWTGSRLAGAIAALFLIFHPAGITLADRALAENILPPLVALCMALGMEYWQARHAPRRRWILGVIFGLCCAAAYHTRREGIVLGAPLVLLAVVWLRPMWRPKDWRSLALGLFLGPIAAIILMGTAISALNYHTWGFWARCQLLSPGYNAALKALYRIKPLQENPRYVTVTNETRRAAYAVSPTFAELEPVIEGQLAPLVQQRDYGIGTPRGEFPDGWFYWDIREAAARTGWYLDTATAEKKYSAIAKEINAAVDDGRISSRAVFTNALSPEYDRWLPQLPNATWAALKLFLNLESTRINLTNRDVTEDVNPSELSYYYSMAGRRRELGKISVHMAGWIQAPAGSMIALGTTVYPKLWTLLETAHPTEQGVWTFDQSLHDDQKATMLWLRLPDQSLSTLPLDGVSPNHMYFFKDTKRPMGVDIFEVKEFKSRAEPYLDRSILLWQWLSWAALATGFLTLVLWPVSSSRCATLLALLILLSFAALLARCMMMAMVELAAWPMQYRYIFPALPMLAISLGVGIASIIHYVTNPLKKYLLN